MKLELIKNWKQAWRFYSVWAMAILLCMPTLFNLAVEYGLLESAELPPLFANAVRLVAFGTVAVRVIKQQVQDIQEKQDDAAV